MTLQLATTPDDPAALKTWLVAQLNGMTLGDLVAELSALRGRTAAESPPLDEIWRPELVAEVVRNGPAALNADAIRTLLRHPQRLLDLQERIILDGGPFWTNLPPAPEAVAMADRAARRFRASLDLPTPAPRTRRAFQPWLTASWVVTAAAVLVAVYVGKPPRDTPPYDGRTRGDSDAAWGWNTPGLLARSTTPADHLTALADAGEQFLTRPHDDRADVRAALVGMRNGCTLLLANDHPLLSREQRNLLITQCADWGAKFDARLAALQTGESPAAVWDAAATDVRNLVGRLRDSAKSA